MVDVGLLEVVQLVLALSMETAAILRIIADLDRNSATRPSALCTGAIVTLAGHTYRLTVPVVGSIPVPILSSVTAALFTATAAILATIAILPTATLSMEPVMMTLQYQQMELVDPAVVVKLVQDRNLDLAVLNIAIAAVQQNTAIPIVSLFSAHALADVVKHV
jgi:hypothetical protein